jgi:hypothetical protein
VHREVHEPGVRRQQRRVHVHAAALPLGDENLSRGGCVGGWIRQLLGGLGGLAGC